MVDFHHALLRHIDSHVLPLIRIDFGAVLAALDAYCDGNRNSKVVDRYLHVESAAQYFPGAVRGEIHRISKLLAVDVPRGDGHNLQEKRVNMLDILLTLTVLVRGSLEEKSRLLFNWFDFSHSGMLTEAELTIFLQRTANCLARIQVISSFEIGQADARHMALLARVKPDGSMVAEVSLERFIEFLDTNRATQTIRRILRIIDRLLHRISDLGHRIHQAHRVVEAKRVSIDESHAAVPRFDSINKLKVHPRSLFVIWVEETAVSFAIPSVGVTDEVAYAMVEGTRPLPADPDPNSNYDANPDLTSNDGDGAGDVRAGTGMAHKVDPNDPRKDSFRAVTYHRCRLVKAAGTYSAPLHRVDLLSLRPGVTVSITIYTDTWCFPAIKVSTRRSRRQLFEETQAWPEPAPAPSTIESNKEPAEATASKFPVVDEPPSSTKWAAGLVVLPADIASEDVQSVLDHLDAAKGCSDVIFTGAICPADGTWRRLLRQALPSSLLSYMRTESASDTSHTVASHVAHAAAAMHRGTLEGELLQRASALWTQVSAPNYGYEGMQAWSGGKRILSLRTCGPWSSSERREAMLQSVRHLRSSKKIGPPLPKGAKRRRDEEAALATFMRVEATLERLHNGFIASLLLPVPSFASGMTQVIPVRPSASGRNTNTADATESEKNTCEEPGVFASVLVDSLLAVNTSAQSVLSKSRTVEDVPRFSPGSGSGAVADVVGRDTRQCVLVIRSPLDLMLPCEDWGRVPVVPVTSETGTDVKLTGAHEIKYGAHSTAPSAARSGPIQDALFERLLRALFAWIETTSGEEMSSSSFSSSFSRSVDIVCTGWIRGTNVSFRRSHGALSTCVNLHCLLRTRKPPARDTSGGGEKCKEEDVDNKNEPCVVEEVQP